MSCDDELDLDRLARRPRRFRRRVVELAPGEELRIGVVPWRDAIVFLETGEVELECSTGSSRRFTGGSVLCLVPPVSVFRACGGDPARLIAIWRPRHSG
jgi:hypothetical protein